MKLGDGYDDQLDGVGWLLLLVVGLGVVVGLWLGWHL